MRIPFLAVLVLVAAVSRCLAQAGSPDTVVICPAALRAALAPWITYRTGQGHEILAIEPGDDVATTQARLRRAAPTTPKYVLVVGDAAATSAASTPTGIYPAKINVAWGSEPQIASDNIYGDFDGDGVPEAAVGRLTADTPAELAAMIAKIVAFERGADRADWQRRLNFVAGGSHAGALIDAALESLTRSLVCEQIPAAYSTSMTCASWRSPYCPAPALFGQTVAETLTDGCLFWVYMGHGERSFLDYLRVPQGYYPTLRRADVARLPHARSHPIALVFACYTGAFDAADDCLAEELLRWPEGPVAVLASSRVTMPYGMGVLGADLIQAYFVSNAPTLGELVLSAKRQSVLAARDDVKSRGYDAMAAALDPNPHSLASERQEHVLLFNLLGDPLLRLPRPGRVQLAVDGIARPGAELTVSGTSPVDGPARIELILRRDRLPVNVPARPTYDPAWPAAREYQQVYQQANDPRLAQIDAAVVGGALQARVRIPVTAAAGACHVRAWVAGPGGCALGAADVEIQKPANPSVFPSARAQPLGGVQRR